ncbi:MAG: peptidoglycan bridge formation glycyltransferase FemA/FemB family protein [Ardenticatenales bacterium]|nr:peptidoglycan bridge formation glycyltransferase FemA/FemB family protein [Ardenticatenales bacterium]
MRTIEDEIAWDALLARLGAGAAGLPSPHVLQSWVWGDLKARWGWTASRFAWGEPGAEWAAAQVLARRVGGSPLRVGYVAKGPFVLGAGGAEGERWSIVLGDLEALARRRGLAVLKIDPDVGLDRSDIADLWRSRGWRRSDDQIQFPNTMRSPLPAAEGATREAIDAALAAAYRPKTRYNVRLAERRGVRVRIGGEADIEPFLALYEATAGRQGFAIRSADYYRDVWRAFLRSGRAVVILAERDGRALAGAVPVRFGETAWYLYGASADDGRAHMAPHAVMHVCQLWAAEQGCRVFDWWGGPTDPADESDPLAGVARFKEGFGAVFAPQLGAWDYSARPMIARALRTAGLVRRRWLRRR